MKRFLATILALCASIAFGATTVPVQLLNPIGSLSGQAIVSTGPSSAPGWTTVANAGANTNITSLIGLTTPLGTWAGGLGANNSSANGVPVFASGSATVTATTGTGSPVLATSPTITTPNIQGVTNGAVAVAGQVGQLLTATASAVSISNSTFTNCISLGLTAGDWNVWGNVHLNPGASTALTLGLGGLSTTSATLPASPNYSQWAYAGTTNFGQSVALPMQIFNVSGSTTVYAVVEAGFASGSANMDCALTARRVH